MTIYSIPGLTLFGVVNAGVQEMVTQFSAHLLNFLNGAPDTKLDPLVNMTPTDALSLKIPINIMALNGYEEWTGERNYVDVDLKAFAIEARPWTRNVAYDMRAAMTGVYGGFPKIAAQAVVEGYKMPGRLAANVLKQGKTKAKTYQNIPLFVESGASVKHLVNPLDEDGPTFYNCYTDRPFTADNFQFAREQLRLMKGPDNVESLGLELTHVVGGTTMEAPFLKVLKKSTMMGDTRKVTIGGTDFAFASEETNIWEGGAVPIVSSLLDSDPYLVAHPTGQVWYAVALNTVARPVEEMGLNGGAPKVEVWGEETEAARLKKKILVHGDLEVNAAAGLPHTIIRFEYAGA